MVERAFIGSLHTEDRTVAMIVVAHNATMAMTKRSPEDYTQAFEQIYKALQDATAPTHAPGDQFGSGGASSAPMP